MQTKLILLRILSYGKRLMHGYEVKKQLKEWAVGEYAEISYGSIYYNLERMEKEGLVAGETVKDSRRPERKLYGITEKGKAELMKLLRKNYFEIRRGYYPFDIGVSMMPLMPKEVVLEALDKRIRAAEGLMEALRKQKAEVKGKIPFFALSIFDHYLYHLEAEKNWLRNLKEEVERRKDYFEDLRSSGEPSHGEHVRDWEFGC